MERKTATLDRGELQRIPCDHAWDCPHLERGCFEDVDHKYHPRRDYETEIEREFRELPENKTLTCRRVHDERHKYEEAPDKPSRGFMINAIRRATQGDGQAAD